MPPNAPEPTRFGHGLQTRILPLAPHGCTQVAAGATVTALTLLPIGTTAGCRVGGTGGGGISPVVANGVVYTLNPWGGQTGVALGSDTGSPLWNFDSYLPSAVDSQHACFVTPAGTLQAFSGFERTASWSFTGDGGLCTSPIVVNQYVFVGSSSGNVYAGDATSRQQLWQVNAGAAIPRGAYDSIAM